MGEKYLFYWCLSFVCRRNLFQKWTRCLAGNMEKMVMGIKSRDSTQVNDVEILRRQELLDKCQVIIFLYSYLFRVLTQINSFCRSCTFKRKRSCAATVVMLNLIFTHSQRFVLTSWTSFSPSSGQLWLKTLHGMKYTDSSFDRVRLLDPSESRDSLESKVLHIYSWTQNFVSGSKSEKLWPLRNQWLKIKKTALICCNYVLYSVYWEITHLFKNGLLDFTLKVLFEQINLNSNNGITAHFACKIFLRLFQILGRRELGADLRPSSQVPK